MVVRRILFFVFLLGVWVQAVRACPVEHGAPAPAHKAIEIAVPAVLEEFAVIGDEHRCDCPAITQDAQSVVSESSKSLIASYMEGASAFPMASNPGSVALAVHARASSFIAHRPVPPPYLLIPRLRQ